MWILTKFQIQATVSFWEEMTQSEFSSYGMSICDNANSHFEKLKGLYHKISQGEEENKFRAEVLMIKDRKVIYFLTLMCYFWLENRESASYKFPVCELS